MKNYTHRGIVRYFEHRAIKMTMADGSTQEWLGLEFPCHVRLDGDVWARGDCRYSAVDGAEIGEGSMWVGRLVLESLAPLGRMAGVL